MGIIRFASWETSSDARSCVDEESFKEHKKISTGVNLYSKLLRYNF